MCFDLSQWEFSHGKFGWSHFPQGKPAATVSRYPTVSVALPKLIIKVHAGPSFRVSVLHRTLTRTTGSLTFVRYHSCACVYTRWGEVGGRHTDSESAQHFWLGKTHKLSLCSIRDSNLGPLDLEYDALPIEPPRHPASMRLWNGRDQIIPPGLKRPEPKTF